MLLAACRTPPPDLTACIPPGTVAVAGIDLEQVKANPVLARLRERVPGLERASRALAAWDGSELLVAASGDFATPPAGAVMASKNVALFGPEAKVKAALAQFRTGAGATPRLLGHAPKDKAIWAAIRGDATLPLPGNAANFNRLLHSTEYTAIAATLSGGLRLEATGTCRTPADAARLRDTAGGLLLLLGVPEPSIEVQGRVVKASVTLPEDALAGLAAPFLR